MSIVVDTSADLWSSLQPLVRAAIDDPERGLLILDPQLRLVHMTSPARSLLGLAEAFSLDDVDLAAMLSQTHLDLTSRASVESMVLQARDRKPLEPVRLSSRNGATEVWMRARNIGQQHLVITFAAVNASEAGQVKIGETVKRDALTGLLTRLHFEEAARAALNDTADQSTAVLLIDLDRFKPVNDTLGHAAGDTVLRLVATRLLSVVRESDCVARLGGDEFALLIHPLAPTTDPANIARRIVDLMSRTYLIEGHLVNIGASVGIAIAPRDGSQYDTLLRCADLALYHCKVTGRGSFHFFTADMELRAQARRTGELDLRRALALRQLELHYQPQVDLVTQALVGFEALIRWRHPERGLIPPADFLPLAEEIGVIVPIGDWVLRTACREAMNWPEHVVVAVNVSPIQFETGRLANSVKNALAAANLPAHRLEIEVTEGILLRKEQTVFETMKELREMNIRIAMDDFGTGHASLSQLAQFAFDKIKIDRSLVGSEGNNAKHRAIVRAIAALGTSLGISTMAEGIETEDQLQRIQSDGCGSVQGYFFSKPMPVNMLDAWIADRTRIAKSVETPLLETTLTDIPNEHQPI